MAKYVIFDNTEYYPHVWGEYDTLKEARKAWTDWKERSKEDRGYLCKIIEKKESN